MSKEQEIVSTRIINAPRALLFKAWEDPDLLQSWWGPEGFTNTFHQFNFVPGGHWEFTMHGPDGTDYPNKSVFENIVAPGLIVFTHLDPVHQFKVTVTLDEAESATKIIFHMLFDSADECRKVKPYVRIANEQNFDRLEAVLLKLLLNNATDHL